MFNLLLLFLCQGVVIQCSEKIMGFKCACGFPIGHREDFSNDFFSKLNFFILLLSTTKKTKLHCWTNPKFKNRISLLDSREKQLTRKMKNKFFI